MSIKNFGEQIRMERKKRELSLDQLALLLSVSKSSISKWECGKQWPSIKNFFRLEKILGTNLHKFISYGSITNRYSPSPPKDPPTIESPTVVQPIESKG